jgi:hypothetical protein
MPSIDQSCPPFLKKKVSENLYLNDIRDYKTNNGVTNPITNLPVLKSFTPKRFLE